MSWKTTGTAAAAVTLAMTWAGLGAAPAQAATCGVTAKVWYDSDQYGTYPKAWGQVTNCQGYINLRTTIMCSKVAKPIVNDTAYLHKFVVGSVYTTTRYIGTCKGGRWTAHLTGSYFGQTINKYQHWTDGGFPA